MTTVTAPSTVTGSYAIDASHSRIGFVARHAMVTKVRGSFNEFEGSGYFDADQPANSHLELVIKAESIDTRNADRDGHLRGNDFFAMDEYPKITFRSTSVEQTGHAEYRVTGDLTIKGITKPVTLRGTFVGSGVDPWGNERIGIDLEGTVDRADWGLSWNAPIPGGGFLLPNDVRLTATFSAVRAS